MNDKSKGQFSRFLERLREISPSPRTEELLRIFSDEFFKQMKDPFQFPPYHERITSPFDFTAFGKEFIGMTLDQKNSKVLGAEKLQAIHQQLKNQENVIFFANHQIEPDPQVIQVLLEKASGSWIDEMIFVAGDRVTKDPIAIPLSIGCNLLCIYSKKYIDTPKELKEHKLLHNKKTLKKMEDLLTEGGKMIYVAPSGGRDRKDADGNLTPAPFDQNSIELFYLISSIAKRPSHFYPLALHTYDLLPPPSSIQTQLGEERLPAIAPAFISIGDELSKEALFVDPKQFGKDERRAIRCKTIYDAVLKEYQRILS